MYTHVKCEGLKSYQSKDTVNVKVFMDKQTDALTNGQAKNYMPPMYCLGGIKSGVFMPPKDRGHIIFASFVCLSIRPQKKALTLAITFEW